jgi:BirA family biotin operon repressor/biotin-[acetyl-CoA-carboxylase] ligase
MDIRFFDKLESTNNYGKLLDPNTVGEFTVICARQQTAGIGQQGNIWVSEPYKNLTFSVILKPTFLAADEQYNLTMAIALAVADTVEHQLSTLRSPFSVHIKWPNDIYVDDSKICGTLVTNQLCGSHISQSICGIGLNVNQTVFPDWLPNPTSLKQLISTDSDLEPLLQNILENLRDCYQQLKDHEGTDDIKARYMSRFYRLGIEAEYIYNDSPIRATITGIDRYGHLQLTTANGLQLSCGMKEIKFI